MEKDSGECSVVQTISQSHTLARDRVDENADAFDKEAASEYVHGRASNPAYQRQASIITDMLGSQYERVLDLGCGIGDLLREVAVEPHLALGIDLSEAMLRGAIRGAQPVLRLSFVRANACEIPVKDRVFDAVVSLGLVEYTWPDSRFISEIHRVLRDGGTLVICFQHGGCVARRVGDGVHRMYLGAKRILRGGGPADPALIHRPTPRAFDRMMRELGFRKELHRYCFPQLTVWPLSDWMRDFDRRLGMALDTTLGRIPFAARIYVSRWRRL